MAVTSGALVGSVFALSAFLAAIRLVGPGTASLLVTVEVPAGLLFAAVALGERLAGPQLAGAALVVGAIGLLQLRIRLPRPRLAEVRPLPVSANGGSPSRPGRLSGRALRVLDRAHHAVPDDRPALAVRIGHAATSS